MLRLIKNIFSRSISVATPNTESNSSRGKLKEATALKQEKKFDEACNKLIEAYSAHGSQDLMIKDRLRLPMYLQLANKSDEAWQELNNLNLKYTDVFSQSDIANQMRIFLQREKDYSQAIIYSAWSICKEIERDQFNIQDTINMADDPMLQSEEYAFLREGRNQKIYGKTPKGNPITDQSYTMFCDRIAESISKKSVLNRLSPLLKKMKKESLSSEAATSISKYLSETPDYKLQEIRDLLTSIITKETKL